MKRGKAKREHNTRRKIIMLGKFYTTTQTVVNAEKSDSFELMRRLSDI